MSRIFHTIIIFTVTFAMILLILFFNAIFQTNSLHATTLYDAVNDSVEYARDDSSRMSRGSFVVNMPEFKNRLEKYTISDISGGTAGNIKYKIYILPDTSNTNNTNENIDNNNNNNSSGPTKNQLTQDNQYSYDDPKTLTNGYINASEYNDENSNKSKYVPIRAIQVQVVETKTLQYHNNHGGIINPSNNTNNYNRKLVATFVVQESTTDPEDIKLTTINNNGTKSSKSISLKEGQGNTHSANVPMQADGTNGVKTFYNDNRSSYDLTTPSYDNED